MKSSDSSSVTFSKDRGICPVKALFDKLSAINVFKRPIDSGICPSSLFPEKSMVAYEACKLGKPLSQKGNVSLMLLLSTLRNFRDEQFRRDLGSFPISRGMLPVKLLFHADKTVREFGGLGNGPLKWFKAKSKILTDEFTKTSVEPSKPVKELLRRVTVLKRGRLHNHSGTFPKILLLEMLCKKFGNSLMLQPDKPNFSRLSGTSESEPKLVDDILLPERTSFNKDLREEKILMKEMSRNLRVIRFEIGSSICPSKWLWESDKCLSEEEELRTSMEPFSLRSRRVKKGRARREEGMAPEKKLAEVLDKLETTSELLLEERDKTSNLLRLLNSEGSEEEVTEMTQMEEATVWLENSSEAATWELKLKNWRRTKAVYNKPFQDIIGQVRELSHLESRESNKLAGSTSLCLSGPTILTNHFGMYEAITCPITNPNNKPSPYPVTTAFQFKTPSSSSSSSSSNCCVGGGAKQLPWRGRPHRPAFPSNDVSACPLNCGPCAYVKCPQQRTIVEHIWNTSFQVVLPEIHDNERVFEERSRITSELRLQTEREKRLIESGGVGTGPSKWFKAKSNILNDEFSFEPGEVDELRTSTGSKGIVRREEGMAPEKMERLVIFCTSGKPPVSSLWSRYNSPLEERDKTSNLLRLPNPDESEEESLVRLLTSGKLPMSLFLERFKMESWLRLLIEEGTWPSKPLEERIKTSNLLRLPNLEGNVEEMKLLLLRSRNESLVRFFTSGKLPVSSLCERFKWVRWIKLLNEEGTWPMKPLEERDKTSNLLRLLNSEGSEEDVKLL
ncbi:LOW QUALITY PROTEIN: hypothetical protein HID58_017779 [Brassica napus]|uniref:Uncharacterized protein n=1 Tax=Brassica napus TaxID=3708 RepID=A0ABQ8D9U5_BRANA|nr:LOW QUALITY PROTEIN: hypothetical protein HID58_017779 [Brassica napus]